MSFAFRPTAAIEIDGRRLTAAEAGLERLTVTLALAAHGYAQMVFWPGSKFADVRSGAALTLSLGEDDEVVLTGMVSTVSNRPDRAVIEGLDATGPLSRTRVSTTFRDQSIGDIVRDLAGRAGVTTDTVEGDLTLQAYSIDNRRSLWRHLTELALLTGADLGATPDGKLRFAAGSGAASRRLRHGAELLDWHTESGAKRTSPSFAAYGAASEAGAQNWHFVLPDPLGQATRTARIPGAVRSREVADTVARAAAIRAARAKSGGHALTLGAPKIRPADTIEIAGLAGGGPSLPGVGGLGGGESNRYRALAVRHRLDGTSGFTTALALEGMGDDASLLGGLGALAGGLV
jgi:hypothetical protein